MAAAKLELDRTDRKILNMLQKSSAITLQQLAEQVGISAPACHRRVHRLRDGGVILGEISLVNPAYAERRMAFWLEITLSSHQPDAFNALTEALRNSPFVSSADVITGDTDILACIHVADMEEFREVTRELMRRCPIIRTFRSITVANRIKFQPGHPFEE